MGLDDLGVAWPGLRTLAWGLGGGVAGFLLFPLCNLLTGGALMRSGGGDQMAAILKSPFALRFMTVVTAAVTEEVLFRGVGLAALAGLGAPLAVGLAVSLAAFVLAHFPGWRPAHLVYVAAAGALLTTIYALTHDLGAAMLAHFVIDGAALLLMPLAAGDWQARKGQ
jgi:membrane protease YdiL (CAAX protease family)